MAQRLFFIRLVLLLQQWHMDYERKGSLSKATLVKLLAILQA